MDHKIIGTTYQQSLRNNGAKINTGLMLNTNMYSMLEVSK